MRIDVEPRPATSELEGAPPSGAVLDRAAPAHGGDAADPVAAPDRSVGPDPVRGDDGLVDGWLCALVAVAAIALNVAMVLLEPAPAEPTAADQWWVSLLDLAFLASMVTAAVGLAQRRLFGLGAALAFATVLLGGVIACPATGHHSAAMWWAVEFAGAAAFLGLTAVALRVALRRH